MITWTKWDLVAICFIECLLQNHQKEKKYKYKKRETRKRQIRIGYQSRKKDGNKRNDKKHHSSPPDSRLPVGDGSSAEREAALFMAALSHLE